MLTLGTSLRGWGGGAGGEGVCVCVGGGGVEIAPPGRSLQQGKG